jgi:uncharacterized protein YqjF (DUF2071 family)
VVRAARWLGLSYYDTRMTVETGSDVIEYLSVRTHKNTAPAELIATYGPTTQVYHATSDTLDHWLTERYASMQLWSRTELYTEKFITCHGRSSELMSN